MLGYIDVQCVLWEKIQKLTDEDWSWTDRSPSE